jgi:hypothetical protein
LSIFIFIGLLLSLKFPLVPASVHRGLGFRFPPIHAVLFQQTMAILINPATTFVPAP